MTDEKALSFGDIANNPKKYTKAQIISYAEDLLHSLRTEKSDHRDFKQWAMAEIKTTQDRVEQEKNYRSKLADEVRCLNIMIDSCRELVQVYLSSRYGVCPDPWAEDGGNLPGVGGPILEQHHQNMVKNEKDVGGGYDVRFLRYLHGKLMHRTFRTRDQQVDFEKLVRNA